MANKRINDLTNNGTYDADLYVEVDKGTLPEAQKMKLDVLFLNEQTAREDQDDVIEAGAGLETDGTYATNEASNYLTAADFAAAGTTPSLKEADNLLDAEIASLAAIMAGQGNLTITTLTVPSNRFKGLNAVPYDLIGNSTDDLGAYYVVVAAFARIYYGTAPINTGGADKLILRYSSGTQIGEWTAAFYQTASDASQSCLMSGNIAIPDTGSVQLYCAANDTGTSTAYAKITIVYSSIAV